MSLSLLSRGHASVISSSPRVGKGVFLSLRVKLGSQTVDFYVCAEHVLVVINFLSSLGRTELIPPLFYCLGACLVLLPPGFVPKQACLLLWLSKAAFLSNL